MKNLTAKQKKAVMAYAYGRVAYVVQDALECDGFKHRHVEEAIGIGLNDELADTADDYFFECVEKIQKELETKE